MSGMKIGFHFVPFPRAIWDNGIDLSQNGFRLLGYLLRHLVCFGNEQLHLTDDDLLNGRRKAKGDRYDKGCGIKSVNGLKGARNELLELGWIEVTTDTKDAARVKRYYKVLIAAEEEAKEPESTVELHRQTLTPTRQRMTPNSNSTVSKNDTHPSKNDTRSIDRDLNIKDKEEEKDTTTALKRSVVQFPASDKSLEISSQKPQEPSRSDHQELMKILYDFIGPISDGKAQGAAVQWLLKHYTVEECRECLEYQLTAPNEQWRSRVSWLSVREGIGTWKAKQHLEDSESFPLAAPVRRLGSSNNKAVEVQSAIDAVAGAIHRRMSK